MTLSRSPGFIVTFVIALGLLGAACTKGGTVGIETGPNLGLATYVNLEVVHAEDAIETPAEVVTRFGQELDKRLFDDEEFERGPLGLTLSYRFLSLEEFKDKMLGIVSQTKSASVTIELEFYDPTGELLARAVVEGRDTSRFTGDLNDVLERAAKEAAKYTMETFR